MKSEPESREDINNSGPFADNFKDYKYVFDPFSSPLKSEFSDKYLDYNLDREITDNRKYDMEDEDVDMADEDERDRQKMSEIEEKRRVNFVVMDLDEVEDDEKARKQGDDIFNCSNKK